MPTKRARTDRRRAAAPPAVDAGAGGRGFDARRTLLLAVTFALLAIVLLPCVVSISSVVHFDVDPRSRTGRAPVLAFGPMGAAWLHVVSVLVAAAAMGVHHWLGGRVRWVACALAGLGAIVCLWQMTGHYDNRVYGGAWLAGVALALAAAHLGEHTEARRWLVAGLAAVIVVMLLDALWWVWSEHPAMVEQYRETEDEVLASRGWEADSAQHRTYEDRILATHAVGPFGLSNVFGSVAAALTVLAVGACAALWRGGVRGWAVAAAGLVLAGGATVWLTESRGAMLALPMGLAVMAAAWAVRDRARWRWIAPTLAVLFVAAAIGAVVLRGAMGPPDTHEGERSLLFRAHYWEGSARIVAEHMPTSLIEGVGVAGFRTEYLRLKNPLSPENVTSPHNVFIDYITMLGVGGLAWSALLLLWLWQAGRGATRLLARDEAVRDGPAALTLGQLALAAGPAAVVFGTQLAIEHQAMWEALAALWLGGAMSWVILAGGLALRRRDGEGWVAAGLFGAAVVLLVHNQIEMSFFQLASAPTLWFIVGLAASNDPPARGRESNSASAPESAPKSAREIEPGPGAGRPSSVIGWLPAAGLGVIAVCVVAVDAVPMTMHQRSMGIAAATLQDGQGRAALAALDRAGEAMVREDRALQWRVRLRIDAARHAAQAGHTDIAANELTEALRVVHEAEASLPFPGPNLARWEATIEQTAADLLDQPERLDSAIDAMRRVVARSPYNLHDRLELGDLYWQTDQRDAAIEQYRAAQRISDNYYLEPMHQLSPRQREHVESRLRAGE